MERTLIGSMKFVGVVLFAMLAGCSPVGYIVGGIAAASSGGGGSDSGTPAAVPPPGTPSGVTAEGGTGEVIVDWNLVTGADSYDLHWSTSPGVAVGAAARISTVSPPHPHTGITDGIDYYYVVTALNAGGESPASLEASARPLGAPTGVAAVADLSEVTISWDLVTGADSYNLYWLNSSGVTKATGTRLSGVTSPYLHAPLTNGETYYYVVTAAYSGSPGDESGESLEVAARPIAAPTGVVAAGGTDEVTVTWNGVAGATSYNLYWLDTPG